MMDHYSLPELARLHQEALRNEADLRRQVALLGRRSLRERVAALLLALAFRLMPSVMDLVDQAIGADLPAEAPRAA